MPFSGYGSRETPIRVSPGGGCPRCGKQTLQVITYKDANGYETLKNVCADDNCGYRKAIT
jgi:ribosomal protein L37E